MKMYLKGGAGIENPVDIDGKEIKEGSILSNDYYDPYYSDEYYKTYWPK